MKVNPKAIVNQEDEARRVRLEHLCACFVGKPVGNGMGQMTAIDATQALTLALEIESTVSAYLNTPEDDRAPSEFHTHRSTIER